MPLPTFSKTAMPTLTFSRDVIFPVVHDYTPQQIVGVSYAGTRRIATIRSAEETFDLVFERLPLADYTALLAWFVDPDINWSGGNFVYTDYAGVPTTVRYLGGPFSFPQVAPGLYSGRIPLVKEVA
jgi:hypothetical protein